MSIPVSQIVRIVPSSLAPPPSNAFMNGLILTQNTALAAEQYAQYEDTESVAKVFGASSIEAQMAQAYFGAYVGASQIPATLYFYGVSSAPKSNPQNQTIASDPASLMNGITDQLQNFAGFTTAWELSLSEKQALAQWTAAQQDNYWAIIWDTDPQALVSSENNTCFGVWLSEQNLDGISVIYKDPLVAAFCLGWMAALDWDLLDGRASLGNRTSPVISAMEGSLSDYTALMGNGYNVYAAFANRSARWNLLRSGSVSGQFAWADSYICQIWLNAALQNALVTLLTQMGQIPYNTDGDGMMNAAIQDPVQAGKNFGIICPGIRLSQSEASVLKSKFGRDISTELFNDGYYFLPNASAAPAEIRAKRSSPACLFAYCDGGCVQTINLPSIEIQ
ncbi:DUF3383 domain-containing protein [Acetobacteraceae bacterium]|nr:DUF3383 domain-containing protein [Acetobacteraceae bacterium]